MQTTQAETQAAASAGQLSLLVRQIRYEATGINSYELVDPDGAKLPSFESGAHRDIHLAKGVVRQYSLCNSPSERHRYVIAVLRDEKGRGGSKALHDSLHVQDIVTVSLPRNHFPLIPSPARGGTAAAFFTMTRASRARGSISRPCCANLATAATCTIAARPASWRPAPQRPVTGRQAPSTANISRRRRRPPARSRPAVLRCASPAAAARSWWGPTPASPRPSTMPASSFRPPVKRACAPLARSATSRAKSTTTTTSSMTANTSDS